MLRRIKEREDEHENFSGKLTMQAASLIPPLSL